MSSRGRGYGGRGSYNGGRGGYRGSYRGSSSRGGYESSRGGRGGSYSSYNNDSRYVSSASRYTSSRDRMDDSYKKPYRTESSSSYSNRDYSGRSGSPERKRMRIEGTSDRRSHDGGHYGGSYSGRQESYGGERRSFTGEERRRSPARESYRKPSGMGPPREPLRSTVRPRATRRSFRGRTMRSRASFRGAPRSRGAFTARRYGERSLGYPRAFRPVKGRSSIKSKDEEASSTDEDWDAEEKEDIIEEKKESKAKSPKAEPEVSEAEGAEECGEDTDKEADAGSDAAPARPYVHLTCVHCKAKCSSFASYAKHLVSTAHRAAMSGVARRHKAQLLRMRMAQRGAQRELESAAGAELTARTTFCLVCRLNHRTSRHAHNLTDTHRAMKRFLMPFCRICRLAFRSPMNYEHHICSIDHLKKKASQSARRVSPKAEGSGDEGMDVDLENFMTLDSVGDVDEVEEDESGGEKTDEAPQKKPKVEINIGSENIKKIEVYWCELCRVYLSRGPMGGDAAEVLRRHCRLRAHLGRYVRHRDTRTLRKQAERIHRQLHQQKEEEEKENAEEDKAETKVKPEKNETNGDKKNIENGTESTNIAGNEDKLWDDDVDKDIGDLLREVGPPGDEASDDEEDLDRYEKYRKNDKKSKVEDADDAENKPDDKANEKANIEINASA